MNITKRIVEKAAAYPAVAFDVFDTLIKRDVAKPEDVFALLGVDFARARLQAEKQAREEASGEVTLSQIYAQPCLKGYDPARECTMELGLVLPNPPVQEAIRILQAQGKHLYYISDMYLPNEQIAAMLTRCGYGEFDGGFVSSSYGVQKRSGALFRRFLHETGLDARDVLFIGDSWRADVAGAAFAGLAAWHLPTENVPEGALPISAWESFVRNHCLFLKDPGEKLGFSVLGILAVSFCRWIHEERQKHPQGRLYFLARDMYLMRQIYADLYPEEKTYYLEVSRRSLCPALLAQGKEQLLVAALPRQALLGKQIAAYCGAECPDALGDRIYDLKGERGSTALQKLLGALHPDKNACLVLDYLHQSGIREGDILVDIGSGGTTQLVLEHLLECTLYGMQLSGDARLRHRLPKQRVSVYTSMHGEDAAIYWAGQPMLERFFSQDIGQTVGYIRSPDGVRTVRQAQPEEGRVRAIQHGVLRFATEWNAGALADLPFTADAAMAPFLRLVRTPTMEEVGYLGSIQVEDGGTYPLATPHTLQTYLAHPGQLKRDLSAARWKIGFFKKLLRYPFPYDRLYLEMKNKKER